MRQFDTETEEYSPREESPRPRRRPQQRPDGAARPPKRPIPDPEGPVRPRKPRPAPRKKYNFISFLRDYRTHLGTGIVLCFSALLMLAVGISFLRSYEADQSVVTGHSATEIVASGAQLENAGGPIGAKLAEYMMVTTFGYASFIMAFYIFVVGLAVMQACRIKFFAFTFRSLFATAALSIILGMAGFYLPTVFPIGGEHGHFINNLVLTYAGELGMYGLSALLAGLMIAVFLHPIMAVMRWIANVQILPRKSVSAVSASAETETETPASELMESLSKEADSEPAISEDEQQLAAELEQSIIEDHSRFMPAGSLDELENETGSDDPFLPDDIDLNFGGQSPQRKPNVAFEDEKPLEPKGEPEFVVVNSAPEPKAEIKHGDHITIDQPYDVFASHSHYTFPPTSLLAPQKEGVVVNEAEQMANKKLIVDALRSYDIEIQRIEATIGPTVTLYEIVPEQGTRIAKIKSLEDDIAMSLSALGIRIIAPIPGKGTIGIEVPNRKPQVVAMRTVLESPVFANNKMALPMALGSTISNKIFMADLAKLPHLLVAGATGQGKSVGLNAIITSLLYSKHPDELKFVLVDPKTVEFSLFETINHQYLAKLPDEPKAVITDPQKVVATLNSLCIEMENRYELLSAARVKQISEYNPKFVARQLNPADGHRYMPYIVVIVDEYADLVMVAGKEVAQPIARITQKARAVGIHMILATQRPSTDVITGMIKNNFTARIAFKVTQGVDSKTILDRPGAQRLIGRGDMLAMMNGVVERVQCAFIDTPEVEAICEYIGAQSGFTSCYELPEAPSADGDGGGGGTDIGAASDEFKRCAMFIASQSQASITMMQRKFEIGFNKAGRFMDQMQQMGIVGPAKGAKPRDVLMTPDEVQRLFE